MVIGVILMIIFNVITYRNPDWEWSTGGGPHGSSDGVKQKCSEHPGTCMFWRFGFGGIFVGVGLVVGMVIAVFNAGPDIEQRVVLYLNPESRTIKYRTPRLLVNGKEEWGFDRKMLFPVCSFDEFSEAVCDPLDGSITIKGFKGNETEKTPSIQEHVWFGYADMDQKRRDHRQKLVDSINATIATFKGGNQKQQQPEQVVGEPNHSVVEVYPQIDHEGQPEGQVGEVEISVMHA